MIFTANDIRRLCPTAYAGLPNEIKSSGDRFIVFEYNISNDGIISVKKISLWNSVGLFIYKNLGYDEKSGYQNSVAYFKSPFDSKNFLFYRLLIALCSNQKEEIKSMYEKFKLNDLESTQKKISQTLIKYDLIIDAISFKNAIKKYLFGFQAEAIADECTRIAEMINCYFSEKNQSLYGDKLSKIINVIADKNGMALPDKINSEMKYMLVGLTSTTAIKSDSYILASSLLRSGFSIVQVYEQTGWFYNKLDKKWRYQISDADSKLHNYVEEQEIGRAHV